MPRCRTLVSVCLYQVQQSLKCPLTGTYLEDPVSNSGCGHTYSRAAVMEHIRHRSAASLHHLLEVVMTAGVPWQS